MSNHPIHASLDMLCDKIDWALKEWKLDYIYVATEDESYCDALMRRYGDQVTFTDQKRYTVREGEMLEYSCAAEPPVRGGVSHLSRRNEPL